MGCGLQPPRMQLFQVPPPFVRRQNKHKKKKTFLYILVTVRTNITLPRRQQQEKFWFTKHESLEK